MNDVKGVVLVLAITTVGLAAGLFAAFAYSVMPGLDRSNPAAAVQVMQRINVAILNPVFAVVFAGGLVFAGLVVVLWWGTGLRWWAVAALALYIVGMLVTFACNVPLNNRLDAAGDVTVADAARIWSDFTVPWVRWNIVRGVAQIGAVMALAGGLVQQLR
ncbi:anthrone oxygenase family protein [Gordonia soli]|uniref:DUF1772 domain-containing protein n=1 Tax=Gordonia soli NBRC 108243 TaxID=1223545 RepID=M0QQ82_9ACTN|nr:anthrone oxygenase family protein [Gordonia soli]GAC70554.1 hypothetical protein GS4_36_00400 [Gordonia soli NBRC 108243]